MGLLIHRIGLDTYRTDLVEHRFKIEKEGKYDVFIEMEDKKDVKIVGMINIDDD